MQNRLKQRLQVRTQFLCKTGLLGDRIGIHHREISLLLRSAQLDEQVEGVIERAVRFGILAIHFIDHNDHPMTNL